MAKSACHMRVWVPMICQASGIGDVTGGFLSFDLLATPERLQGAGLYAFLEGNSSTRLAFLASRVLVVIFDVIGLYVCTQTCEIDASSVGCCLDGTRTIQGRKESDVCVVSGDRSGMMKAPELTYYHCPRPMWSAPRLQTRRWKEPGSKYRSTCTPHSRSLQGWRYIEHNPEN